MDDLEACVERRVGERGGGARTRLVVQPARDAPPDLVVVGLVEVLPTVAAPLVQLLVDVAQHGDPRLAVLRGRDVAERLQGARLVDAEEPDRRRVLDAVEHDLPRPLVPVALLGEHVVVGIAADHLRRHALPLPREPMRIVKCLLRGHCRGYL